MNSEQLTCIEGLSLSLTSKRTPRKPKRIGTLTTKPAKRVESFVFIVVGYLSLVSSGGLRASGIPCLPRLRSVRNRPQTNDNGLITCRHFTCRVMLVAIVRIKYVNDRCRGRAYPSVGVVVVSLSARLSVL